jgi:hypothetical protein
MSQQLDPGLFCGHLLSLEFAVREGLLLGDANPVLFGVTLSPT